MQMENEISIDSIPVIESGPAFRPLDPRVVPLWRATNAIGYGILLLAQLIALFFIPFKILYFWLAIVGWAVLVLICFWLAWMRPPRVYRSWSYRIDDRVLEIRNGLLFQRTRLLPLSRLQHVDIERGPFERRFGLATLVLHTAGTHEASMTIPGLEESEAVRLRNHLIEIGGDDAV
jgi:hypothetical protein